MVQILWDLIFLPGYITETPQDYSHIVFTNVFEHLLCARLRAGSEIGVRHLEQDTALPSNNSQV